MEISNFLIKLTGKAELPAPVDIGSNYHVALEGSITSVTNSDNEDGTVTQSFTFRPIKVDVLTPMGQSIKAKDTRSNSQLLRALLYKKWVNLASTEDFETWYTKIIYGVMRDLDELIDRYDS